jgi:hypothetical protein
MFNEDGLQIEGVLNRISNCLKKVKIFSRTKRIPVIPISSSNRQNGFLSAG